MRTLLFEPDATGHRETYLRRAADALAPGSDVTVAVTDELAARLDGIAAELHPIGPGRESGTFAAHDRRLARRAEAELERLRAAVAAVRPDHALHLSADAALRALAGAPDLGTGLSLLLFRARAHYPSSFGSRLTARERAVSATSEWLLRRWRRRPDANAVLTLDPVAASRWAARGGARAAWLPEPPVLARPAPVARRSGCALIGSLAPRKGLQLLAAPGALPEGAQLVLAGTVAPGQEAWLDEQVERLRSNGVRVDLRLGGLREQELLDVLAAACCALLPYPRHFGMSRVLVEAAVAGTPVVAHDFGLVGHLTREHGLGTAVDCADAAALGGAIGPFLSDPAAVDDRAPALRRFAAGYEAPAFAAALTGALRGGS